MGERYLIPRRITQRWELFPGWGKPELLLCFAGAGVGALLAGLATLLGAPIYLVAPLAALPLTVAVVLAMPMAAGGNMAEWLFALRAYTRTRHLYLFDFGRDDT